MTAGAQADRPEHRPGLASVVWLVPPFIVGAAVRLYGLRDQIIGGDELHAVRAVLDRPLGELLTTFDKTYYAPLLAAFDRIVLELTGSLSEMTLRAPALLAGLLLMLVLPRSLERRIGRPSALLLAWLVALSPVLVLYSRIARAYMPVVLVAGISVLAFYRWLERRRLRDGVAYALLASVAVYLHLLAAPLVFAPFAFAVAEGLLRPRADGPRPGPLTVLAASTGLVLAMVVVPSWDTLHELVGSKSGRADLGLHTAWRTLQMQAGVTNVVLVMAFWALAGRGLVALGRLCPRFAWYTVTLVAAQLGAVVVLSPWTSDRGYVFNRYVIVATPVVLTWVAAGLGLAWWRDQDRAGITGQRVVAFAFVLILALLGPFSDGALRRSSFTHHRDLAAFYRDPGLLPDESVPGFYRTLFERPPGPILEFPWNRAWSTTRSLYVYQRIHGRRVLVASINEPLLDDRVRFRNLVQPEPEAFLASPARFLVVHVNVAREENPISEPWETKRKEKALRRFAWKAMGGAGRNMALRLRRAWGDPEYEDGTIEVWDLEAARKLVAPGADGGGDGA